MVATCSAAACDTGFVEVTFDIPAPYTRDVRTVSLQVVAPPESDPFDCGDIAFQEVSLETIRGASVQDVRGTLGRTFDLAAIPRVGSKLFYARALDEQGLPVAAACEAIETIDGSTTVELLGEPTAVTASPSYPLDEPLADSVALRASDPHGEPLPDRPVRWTVVAPNQQLIAGEGSTNALGDLRIVPTTPAMAGPTLLDVRPRWERGDAQPILGFYTPREWHINEFAGPDEADLVATESRIAVGRIGPNGEMGYVALGVPTSAAAGRRAHVGFYNSSPSSFTTADSAPVPLLRAVGRITRSDRDHVFSIVAGSWLEFDHLAQVSTHASPISGTAIAISPLYDCTTGAIDAALVQLGDLTLRAVTSDRTETSHNFDVVGAVVIGSGCISVANSAYPAVAFFRAASGDEGRNETFLVADMDQPRLAVLPLGRQGISFTPASATAPPLLLGTEVSITGVSVSRFQFVSVGTDRIDPEKITQDDTSGAPFSTAAGDIDGDGNQDVVALLGFGDSRREVEYRVHIALGMQYNGSRLVGLSPEDAAVRPRLWLADFDNDGADDVLIGSPYGVHIARAKDIASR